MLRALVRNTLFSGLAFVAVGLLNLLVIPITINGYGLTGWGLIVLLRVFLPTGFFAIFDFGVPETATLVVARARASGDWAAASEQLSMLLVGACVVGALTGGMLVLSGSFAAAWFHVGSEYRDSFVWLTRVTGLALLALYPGLLVEGVVKGFERYGLLRLLEVVTALAYAVATIYAVRAGYP